MRLMMPPCWRVVRLLALVVQNLQIGALPTGRATNAGPSHCQCLAVIVDGQSSIYEFTGHFTAARPSYIRKQSLLSLNYEHGLLFYSRHGTWVRRLPCPLSDLFRPRPWTLP